MNIFPWIIAIIWLMTSAVSAKLIPDVQYSKTSPEINLKSQIPDLMGDWVVDKKSKVQIVDPFLDTALSATYTQTEGRVYHSSAGQRVMLSIAYGDNQRKSKLHTPPGCYRAQGFAVESSIVRSMRSPSGEDFPITEMRAKSYAGYSEYVTYWIVYGDSIASGRWAGRYELFMAQLSGVVPDGILIRVSSVGESSMQYSVNEGFIKDLLSSIDPKLGARLVPKVLVQGR